MHEAAGGVGFFGEVFADAAAGIDGQGEVEGQFGLALEDGDLLGAGVFSDLEIFAGEAADDAAVVIGDVDEDADQADIDVGVRSWGNACGDARNRRVRAMKIPARRPRVCIPSGAKARRIGGGRCAS